jgi:hypothetical protein
VLDVGRAAVFAWAFLVAYRARAWREAAWLALLAYVFLLELASGFTFQRQGTVVPAAVNLVVLLGPSGMPRGDLPPLPLASLVVQWPALTNGLAAIALAIRRRRLAARISGMQTSPSENENAYRLGRVASALAILALFEGLCALTRQLPQMLGDRIPDE